MITLSRLLDARDRRRETQMRLMSENPGLSLLVLMVNIPGDVKRTPESYDIGMEGVAAVRHAFAGRVCSMSVNDFETGFEAFFLVTGSPDDAKRLAVGIEESHPLGRLMDIDVIGGDGAPLSRSGLGHAPRRCLVCGDNARICMRTRRHAVGEILDEIHRMHHGYFQRT